MTGRSIIAFAIGCVLAGAACFVLGVRETRKSDFTDLNILNDSTQAMLAFNRVQDERHWEHLLKNNCIRQAAKAIDVAQDKDAELLARLLRGQIDKDVLIYIQKRDPAVIGELKTFKSKYGNSWYEEECGH
ncbi:MAG: hypothetical protein ACREHF_10745 [Rhizomicrobium sp.]